MPKMYLNKRVDEIPRVGDMYRVMGVYPGSTDDLFRPRVEVYVELVKPPAGKPDADVRRNEHGEK